MAYLRLEAQSKHFLYYCKSTIFSVYVKVASGETIREFYECWPLLGIFLCVKKQNLADGQLS